MSGRPVRLMLRGLCSHVEADRFYYLAASKSEFLGMFSTKLTFSTQLDRWVLMEMRGDKVIATPENNFPLGRQPWFLDSCKDPETSSTRTLSLHLDVEQPGHFCCDDGSCIDSEMVKSQKL